VILLTRVPEWTAAFLGILTVFVIRTMASRRRWDLPVYVLEPEEQENG
jgi:uncharacterized membrane protein YeiH